MPLGLYLEDTGTGPYYDGPNQDLRESSNWEEWLRLGLINAPFGIRHRMYPDLATTHLLCQAFLTQE